MISLISIKQKTSFTCFVASYFAVWNPGEYEEDMNEGDCLPLSLAFHYFALPCIVRGSIAFSLFISTSGTIYIFLAVCGLVSIFICFYYDLVSDS